jgi:hypothetical protein
MKTKKQELDLISETYYLDRLTALCRSIDLDVEKYWKIRRQYLVVF